MGAAQCDPRREYNNNNNNGGVDILHAATRPAWCHPSIWKQPPPPLSNAAATLTPGSDPEYTTGGLLARSRVQISADNVSGKEAQRSEAACCVYMQQPVQALELDCWTQNSRMVTWIRSGVPKHQVVPLQRVYRLSHDVSSSQLFLKMFELSENKTLLTSELFLRCYKLFNI